MVISSPTGIERIPISLVQTLAFDYLIVLRLTDLGWRPGNTILVGIDTVHHEFTTAAAVVDSILEDLDATGGLNNNVEAIRVVGLQSFELSGRVLARESDIFISSIEALGKVHLQTLRSSNDDLAATVEFEHLSKDETSGASAKHQHGRTHLGSDPVKAVSGTRGRFKESCIDVGKVVDFEDASS